MKKYGKLLCSILVVAILASSLAFVVGAAEEDAFTPSFEVKKFNGDAISDGLKLAGSEVEGNRATEIVTNNPSDSPYISVGKVEGKNPYIVTYINQTTSGKLTSGNNLSVALNTDASEPFAVVGSTAKGYYVIDVDVATHGATIPNACISVVMRRETDGAGYPFSDDIPLGKYISDVNGWNHITVIGDIANNVAMVYVNGVYAGNAGKAVKNVNDPNLLANDTKVTARGYRIELSKNNVSHSVTQGQNIAFDNLAHRLYIEDGDALAAALSDGNITDWDGYTSGRGGEKLATLATANGIEYRNANLLESVLNTNDAVNVEFKAKPLGPVKVNANAVINTNGMPMNDLITLGSTCTIKSEKGNIITTTSPFVSNYEVKKFAGSVNTIVRASNSDNQLGASDNHSGIQYYGYNVNNMRGTFLVRDTYTGVQYIRDTVYSGTVAENANTYIDWHTSDDKKYMTYKLGVDQHIIFDIDFAIEERGRQINLNPITRTSGGSGVWGNTSGYFNDIFTKAGIADGEFAHVTAVITVDTREMTIFVNGKYVMTVANAISTNAEGHYCNGIRTFSSCDATAGYTNVSLRAVESKELATAIAAKDISLWSDNLYDADYKLPTPVSMVTIDGVAYYNEAEIEAELYGNREKPAVVKILRAFDNVLTVNCDAVIYTYGQDVKFVDIDGNELIPEDGVINLDLPYMQNREEEKLTVSGTSLVSMANVYKEVKADVNHNIFNVISIHTALNGIWGAAGYRNASLITNVDTGDVFYRESATPNADGTMNTDGNQYVNMSFDSTAVTYEEGKNKYIVADFDFGTDGDITDDISIMLIPRDTSEAKKGAWANNIVLGNLGIPSGKMVHVTVVFDFTNNYAYVFVDGVYIQTVQDGAIDGELGGVADNNIWQDQYLAGVAFNVKEIKLCSDQKKSTVCFDNIAIRAYDLDNTDDDLLRAVSSMDITKWDDSIYTDDYVTSKLPAVATVDGEDYGSISALNEALAKESAHAKEVIVKHTPQSAIKIVNDATVQTNSLDVIIDSDTGAYQFDPGIEDYRSTSTGLAYATSRLLHSVVGTLHSYRTINGENCMTNATPVIWAYDAEFKNYDVVFYAYGDTIAPLDGGEYVKGNTFYREQWKEMTHGDEGFQTGEVIESFPVASPITATKFYLFSPYTEPFNFAATDIRYGAKIATDIELTLYVKKDQTSTDTGKTVVIDGVEYVAISYNLAPSEIDSVITVNFDVQDDKGNTFVQRVTMCFVEYAEALLSTFGSEEDKALTVACLEYANAAHVLFDGKEMESVSKLIETYSDYRQSNELTEKLDTSALAPYIRTAAMKLDSAPSFVFKVARGFVGTIEFSYDHLGEVVKVTKAVDARGAEELVALDGLGVFDLCSDITISVTESDSDTPVVGSYNLASYAQGLTENDFAIALYNYAKAALAYKSGSSDFATPAI